MLNHKRFRLFKIFFFIQDIYFDSKNDNSAKTYYSKIKYNVKSGTFFI